MGRQNRRRVVVALLVVAWGIPATASGSPDVSGPPDDAPGVLVSTDNLKSGAVIAQGSRVDRAHCEFEPVKLKMESASDQTWEAYQITDDCQMVIVGRWSGPFENGPSALVGDVNVPPSKTDTLRLSTAVGGRVTAAATTCKTSWQLVYTYGYGGPAFDKLTQLDNSIDYCYDGSQVWITSYWGQCSATQLPTWQWVIDGCVTSSVNTGPSYGTGVWHTDRGSFHCNPPGQLPCNASNPDGYYHTLYNDVDAKPNGSSSCTWWYGGQIVLGPRRMVFRGCGIAL